MESWIKIGPVAFDSSQEARDWAIDNIRLSWSIERDGPFWRVEIPAYDLPFLPEIKTVSTSLDTVQLTLYRLYRHRYRKTASAAYAEAVAF